MASPRQRVDQQTGFILHGYPYRESSLIVEVFSRDHGRVALLAKGARRPHSTLRGVLMAFQPLLVDWSGGAELKTLVRAEWLGGQPLLGGRALLCGYYLNELLVKLLAREDAHPSLFEHYAAALGALSRGEATEELLRRFELALLRELGYGLDLTTEAGSGRPVRAEDDYLYIIDQGVVPAPPGASAGDVLAGRTLLDLAANTFTAPQTLAQAKLLLRRLINHYLGGQTLESRRVFMELQEL